MNIEKNKWYKDTDYGDEETRYFRFLGNREWEIIGNMWIDTLDEDDVLYNRFYIVRYDNIDMSLYSKEEMDNFLAGYNLTVNDIKKTCDGDMDEVDFEVFNHAYDALHFGDDSFDGMFTEKESIDYIENYIKEN